MNRMRNVKRTVAVNFVGRILLLLTAFVIKTLIVRRLGVEYVGLGSLFSSVLQVLGLTELGFGAAITCRMYRPAAEDDRKKLCALLAFQRKVCLAVGAAILTLGLAVMPLLPRLVTGNVPPDINLYTLFLIYLANAAGPYLCVGYMQTLYTAQQRVDSFQLISVLSNLLMNACQILALLLTRDYYLYIIFMPLFNIGFNIAAFLYGKKLFPDIRCVGGISPEERKAIRRYVSGYALSQLSVAGRSAFDSIVISMFLGLTELGKYQISYTVITVLAGVLTVLTTAFRPAIGSSVATGSPEKTVREFTVFSFGYRWISSWCAVCLLCLIQPFVRLWTGTENVPSFPLALLLSLLFYVSRIEDVYALYKEVSGMYARDRIRPVLESAVNLVLNVLLVVRFGVCGIVAATVLSLVCVNLPLSVRLLFRECFRTSPGPHCRALLRDLLLFLLSAAAAWGLCLLTGPLEDLPGLLIRAAICLAVPNLLYYGVYHRSPLFSEALGYLGIRKKSRKAESR